MPSSSYQDVRATLADARFVVPAPQPVYSPSGVAWLRANVARFSTGPAHTSRRTTADDQLSTVDPAALRRAARAGTTTRLAAAGSTPVDLMSIARTLPTELLGEALGLAAINPDTVAAIARCYPTGAADAAADKAVDELIAAGGGVPDESTAARIGLLVQACEATAGLIGNAAFAMLHKALPDLGVVDPVEAILAETLRHSPPVRATKRVSPAGAVVELDLAAANRDGSIFADPDRFDPLRANNTDHLDFGFGSHACPGHHHATQLAAGVLDAVRGCRLRTERLAYLPSANLRVPTELIVLPGSR